MTEPRPNSWLAGVSGCLQSSVLLDAIQCRPTWATAVGRPRDTSQTRPNNTAHWATQAPGGGPPAGGAVLGPACPPDHGGPGWGLGSPPGTLWCAGGVVSGPARGEGGTEGGPWGHWPLVLPQGWPTWPWLWNDVAGGACVARPTTMSLSQKKDGATQAEGMRERLPEANQEPRVRKCWMDRLRRRDVCWDQSRRRVGAQAAPPSRRST